MKEVHPKQQTLKGDAKEIFIASSTFCGLITAYQTGTTPLTNIQR
jgi:hypothetical protein